jgi:predicted phosphodiesterase
MATIALFSDIHANLPALEAFFRDLDARQPDAVYCLGDLVGYNTWPNEVVNAIRARGIPTIAGNYDYGIGRSTNDCGCAYKTDAEKSNGQVSIAYTNAVMQPAERAYLRSLPAHIRVEYRLNDDPLNLLLVHGSPRRINEYLFEDRDEKSLLRILQEAGADILCFGHTHKPYHRVIAETTAAGITRYRHAINTGSVGKPKDGNPQGGYVLLHLDAAAGTTDAHSIRVEFIRFPYEVERAARAIEESPLPDVFADMLRNGG